ncbi:NLPA lipofamily protein, partial [Chlamydia psittaci 09DC77]
RSRFIERLQFD